MQIRKYLDNQSVSLTSANIFRPKCHQTFSSYYLKRIIRMGQCESNNKIINLILFNPHLICLFIQSIFINIRNLATTILNKMFALLLIFNMIKLKCKQ